MLRWLQTTGKLDVSSTSRKLSDTYWVEPDNQDHNSEDIEDEANEDDYNKKGDLEFL